MFSFIGPCRKKRDLKSLIMRKQLRLWSACASAQSNQSLPVCIVNLYIPRNVQCRSHLWFVCHCSELNISSQRVHDVKWRRIKVDATWWRRIDVDTTSFCSSGHMTLKSYRWYDVILAPNAHCIESNNRSNWLILCHFIFKNICFWRQTKY